MFIKHSKQSIIGVFTPIIMHRISPYNKGSSRDWMLTMGKFCKFHTEKLKHQSSN